MRAAVLAAVLAAIAVAPASGAPGRRLHVRIDRVYGPADTILQLDADGTLRRFEGSDLTLLRSGTLMLDEAVTRSFFTGAERLAGVATRPAPVEAPFHLYLVAIDGKMIVSTPAALAPPAVSDFIGGMNQHADRVPLTPADSFLLETQDAPGPSLAQSDQETPINLTPLDRATADLVAAATAPGYDLRPIDSGASAALQRVAGGRKAFIVLGANNSRHLLRLWSPQEGLQKRNW